MATTPRSIQAAQRITARKQGASARIKSNVSSNMASAEGWMMQRTMLNPRAASPQAIRTLQQHYGNQAVQRLLATDTRPPAHTLQPGTSAQQQMIQRTLKVDGKPIMKYEDLSSEQQGAIRPPNIHQSQVAIYKSMVEELIQSKVDFDLTTGECAEVVLKIYKSQTGEPPDQAATSRIDKLVKEYVESLGNQTAESAPASAEEQQQIAGLSITSRGPYRQDAFQGFLAQRPKFAAFLKQRRLAFHFGSQLAKSFGGGVYKREEGPGGTVHLSQETCGESPEVFTRLLLHEVGHGTFQQLLLKAELADTTSQGQLGELLAQYQQYERDLTALQTPTETGTTKERRSARDFTSSAEQMTALLAKQENIKKQVQPELAKFTEDGRRFYAAWLILRADDGKYLMGLDLGGAAPTRRDAAQRQTYQAGEFEEFCAESFMHMAREKGALQAHIQGLKAKSDVPPSITDAWDKAWEILQKYERLLLLEWKQAKPTKQPAQKTPPKIGAERH